MTHCACPDPLPPVQNWECSSCGNRRRYFERVSVGAGGFVSRCGECRSIATSERDVALTLCRFVTETTLLAGAHRGTDTYYLCDACADAEISLARQGGADIFDGRLDAADAGKQED